MFANDEPALNDIAGMKAIHRQERQGDEAECRVRDMLTARDEVSDLHSTYSDDESERAIFDVIQAANGDDAQACKAAADNLRAVFEKWAAHRVEFEIRRAA